MNDITLDDDDAVSDEGLITGAIAAESSLTPASGVAGVDAATATTIAPGPFNIETVQDYKYRVIHLKCPTPQNLTNKNS